jgi:hypothetical protein
MFKAFLFSTFLITSACSKKDNTAGAPADKPASGEAAKPAGDMAKPAAPAAGGKATCDTILKKEIRDKYFANHKIEDVEFPVKHAGKCKLTTPDGKTFELNAACESFMKNAKDASIEGLKKQFAEMKELAGVGDAALAMEIDGADMRTFTAYNKGSFCQVNGTVPKAVDVSAFLNDWLASLPTG